MKNNIIYSNKENYLKTLENIKKDWIEKLHILADFDKTLTKAFVNGEKRPSLISVLRHQKILWEDYSKKAFDLFDYYNPIEIDPKIEIQEKKEQMTIWWEKHLDLLIKSWLSEKNIDEAINSWIIKFRDWVVNFLKSIKNKNIPLIIISANCLWVDSNLLYLKQNKVDFKNIDIISNKFIWDKKWIAIDYEKPVIHVFNKDETVLENFPEIIKKIKNRKNVILLWDSLWDPSMVDWFEYENLIKIWFLNDIDYKLKEEKDLKLLEAYKEKYDVIITWDWDFDVVNKIMEEIINISFENRNIESFEYDKVK